MQSQDTAMEVSSVGTVVTGIDTPALDAGVAPLRTGKIKVSFEAHALRLGDPIR